MSMQHFQTQQKPCVTKVWNNADKHFLLLLKKHLSASCLVFWKRSDWNADDNVKALEEFKEKWNFILWWPKVKKVRSGHTSCWWQVMRGMSTRRPYQLKRMTRRRWNRCGEIWLSLAVQRPVPELLQSVIGTVFGRPGYADKGSCQEMPVCKWTGGIVQDWSSIPFMHLPWLTELPYIWEEMSPMQQNEPMVYSMLSHRVIQKEKPKKTNSRQQKKSRWRSTSKGNFGLEGQNWYGRSS